MNTSHRRRRTGLEENRNGKPPRSDHADVRHLSPASVLDFFLLDMFAPLRKPGSLARVKYLLSNFRSFLDILSDCFLLPEAFSIHSRVPVREAAERCVFLTYMCFYFINSLPLALVWGPYTQKHCCQNTTRGFRRCETLWLAHFICHQ